MRELTSHKVNGCNDGLIVTAVDGPGPGGASHGYRITGGKGCQAFGIDVQFQNGPLKEAGVNGVTHEALLTILIDRLEGFQAGPYACDANGRALRHVREAQAELLTRTRERLARGVEGTHAV